MISNKKPINKQYVEDEVKMDELINHKNPLIRLVELNRRRKLLSMIDNGKIVADIGSEYGHLAKPISKKSKRIYCIDIDKKNIEVAKEKLSSYNNIEYIVSDIINIDLPDNTVDITVASCILEHIQDIHKALSELLRITKPGGKVVICVPNENFILFAKRLTPKFMLGNLRKGQAIEHVHTFNKKLVKKVMSKYHPNFITYDYPFFCYIFISIKSKL